MPQVWSRCSIISGTLDCLRCSIETLGSKYIHLCAPLRATYIYASTMELPRRPIEFQVAKILRIFVEGSSIFLFYEYTLKQVHLVELT